MEPPTLMSLLEDSLAVLLEGRQVWSGPSCPTGPSLGSVWELASWALAVLRSHRHLCYTLLVTQTSYNSVCKETSQGPEWREAWGPSWRLANIMLQG